MLTLDRVIGMHFFTADLGGNPMMYINLIWAWGHPEVYILDLTRLWRSFSEVVSTFSQKTLFGYTLDGVGDGRDCLYFVPRVAPPLLYDGRRRERECVFRDHDDDHRGATGVKIFNWLFTMLKRRVHL